MPAVGCLFFSKRVNKVEGKERSGVGAPPNPSLRIPATRGTGCWMERVGWKELAWVQVRPAAMASLPSR